jgi:gamma-glutamyltranspeptidase/glutathione hydrolase
MLVHLARTGQTFAIDSRERAPAGATPGMFAGRTFDAASTSGIAVAYRAWCAALRCSNWGNLILAEGAGSRNQACR